MTDPVFAECRKDETPWDVTVSDGLENIDIGSQVTQAPPWIEELGVRTAFAW
jgi:hypothetical protein